MKKFLSIVLCLTVVFSMSATAFAADSITQTRTQSGIIGEIFYENTVVPESNSSVMFSDSEAEAELNTIVSYVNNSDGSVTIYEYTNNELSQYHTTVPGSGVLNSTYINADGTERTETTITKEQSLRSGGASTRSSSSLTSSQSNINNPTSIRTLGYMHYRHTFTNTLYSISCEVIERYHPDEEYTFNANTGGQVSFWVGAVLSVCMLTAPAGTLLANAIVQKCITYGLIALGAGTTYFGVGSQTIRYNWYEQEIHGTPTAPANTGSQKYLSGIYAYVNYGSGPEVQTEGYTVRDWGNGSMGRWMMYNVFGIDEAPTSWTGLNRSLAPAQ